MKTEHFFMVYLEGFSSPTYRHDTIESAEKEAMRLAKEKKAKAFVLCSLKSFEIKQFTITDCRPSISDDGELPF